jgi:hypothetical protein
MVDEQKTLPDADDDWLTDIGEGKDADGFGQFDQASIDRLLGEAGVAGDGREPETGMDNLNSALKASGRPPGDEEGSFELDQAALDALLNNSDTGSPAEYFATDSARAPRRDPDAVDQAALAALLDTDDDDFQAALADDSNVPSQADIDELFAQAQDGDDGPGAARDDDLDMNELFGRGADNSALHDKELSGAATAGFRREGPVAGRKAVAFLPEEEEDITLNDDIFQDEEAVAPASGQKPRPWRIFLPARLLAKAPRPLWGGVMLTVLLAGGLYFLAFPGHVPPPSKITEEAPRQLAGPAPAVHEQPQPGPAEYTPPTVVDRVYQMPEPGGEMPLLLFAQNAGDALIYEITLPPAHGRLAGDLPTPVYLPNNDFPGSDRLEYRVTDGRQYSEPATILITGPNLQPASEKEADAPALAPPGRPFLQARDVTLKTLSTRELIIDWRQLWQQTTDLPFPEEASVEVFTDGLHGKLTQIEPLRHRYQPDRLFSGSEVIGYRLRHGPVSSKRAELRLLVDRGDYPPEIKFHSAPGQEIGEYLVGETVVLDASGTMDDDPESLRFDWQQTAGPAVRLVQLNLEGSIVSFVVPSSFYTVADPGPELRLTVTDRSGQRDEKSIKITPRSRRHSALWQGAAFMAEK